MKIVDRITRATLPPWRFISRCTVEGCTEAPRGEESVAFLRGWWSRHVRETGHEVVIEEDEP